MDCGSDVNFYESCSYKWKRDNRIIYPGHRYITVKSLLIIVNLTVADAGHYQCTISDSVKRRIRTNTINLLIKGTYVRVCVSKITV